MQTDPNLVVDWESWLRSRPGDIRRPDRVIVRLGGDWLCQLCSRRVNAGSRAEHHLGHMLDLDAWLVAQEASGPKPDSTRRSTDRRNKRRLAREQAEAFGRDSYLYALDRVEKVAPNKPEDKRVRPILRRRLRHPREETLARARVLVEQGAMPSAVADELRVSDNYARRLIREIEGSGGLK
jgi:hypothetical protein